MNDILPKPFKKEGLLSMLEKHLSHLKEHHAQTDTAVPHAVQLYKSGAANRNTVLAVPWPVPVVGNGTSACRSVHIGEPRF